MKQLPEPVRLAGIAAIYLLLLAILFSLFRSEPVYRHTLGKISSTERKTGNDILSVKEAFLPLTAENLRHWDVPHYERIRDTGYRMEGQGSYYLYAFYPLFPYVWKLSGMNVQWIGLLNYLFYAAGLILLFSLFAGSIARPLKTLHFLLFISLPSSVVFLIPYSEALFFLLISLVIWSYMKDYHWLFFLFLLLAAMTRRASFLLLAATFAASFLLFIQHRNWRQLTRDLLMFGIPVVLGTGIVSVIHHASGSGSFFTFIHVTGSFAREPGLPKVLSDWSHNSFPLNMGVLFIFLPMVVLYMLLFLLQFLRKTPVGGNPTEHKKQLLAMLSGSYFLAAMAFILLFQGGSLNSTFRGILCTPFLAVSLFYLRETSSRHKIFFAAFILCSLLGLALFFTASYTSYPLRFCYLSLPLLILFLGTMIFKKTMQPKAVPLLLYAGFILLSATLTIYLFDVFLGNGWIFT